MKRILCSLLLAVPLLAYAQEASEPSDDFEASLFSDGADFPGSQELPAMAGSSSSSLDAETTEYLLGGTAAIRSTAILAASSDGLTIQSDLGAKVFAKVSIPDFGALYVSYLVSHPLLQAYTGDGSAPTADDAFAPEYALSELHYSFDIGKRLFIRIGNQLLAWGPSRIWTPVDFINLEKSDAFAALDARVGKPGLRLHAPLQAGNLFFFADFSDLALDGAYGDPLRDTRLGARADFTAGAFEFGLSTFGGVELPARLGLDLTGRLFAATIYAELAVAPSWATWEAETLAALGFSKALGDLKRWTLSAEAFWNSPGSDLGGYSLSELVGVPADRLVPLYQGRYYAYAALNAREFLSPSLSSTLSIIANVDDGSFSLEFAEDFAFPRAVPFSLALAWAGGGADREFTRYAGNGSLSLKLTTRAEF